MSDSSKILRNSFQLAGIINIVISAVVAVLSYFSFVLIGRTFGGSVGSDAFFYLFSLNTIASGIITCLYSVVLLPIFVDIKYKEGLSRASDFAGSVLGVSVLCVTPIAVVAYVWYGQFFSVFSKFNNSQIEAVRFVLIYFAPLFIITVVSEFYRIIVLASGHYILSALGAIFQPALLIVFICTCANTLKEEALSLSLLLSKVLLLIFVVAVSLRIIRIKISICFKADVLTWSFFRVSAPYWAANVISSAAVFFFDYVATGLGTGTLSALAYAQKIYNLPISVVLNPIFEIARTRFCEARAKDNPEHFAYQHNMLMQGVIYYIFPVTAVFYFLSREIIELMFQSSAFGSENIVVAAESLRIYALSLPFNAMFVLNGRVVESFQRLVWPSLFGTVGQFLSIYLTLVAVHNLGYRGIPISKVCIDLFYFFPFGFIAIKLFIGHFNLQHIARVVMVALVSSFCVVFIYFNTGLSCFVKTYSYSISMFVFVLTLLFAMYSAIVLLIDKNMRKYLFETIGKTLVQLRD